MGSRSGGSKLLFTLPNLVNAHFLFFVNDFYWTEALGSGGFGRTFLAVDEYKPSQPLCAIFRTVRGPIEQLLREQQTAYASSTERFYQEAVRLEQTYR